jgi:Arc/MetJ family transcription regulator
MRTNIILDDELVQRAKELTGIETKRAVVNEALRLLVHIYEQKEVRSLRGKLTWEGDLNSMREDRFGTAS